MVTTINSLHSACSSSLFSDTLISALFWVFRISPVAPLLPGRTEPPMTRSGPRLSPVPGVRSLLPSSWPAGEVGGGDGFLVFHGDDRFLGRGHEVFLGGGVFLFQDVHQRWPQNIDEAPRQPKLEFGLIEGRNTQQKAVFLRRMAQGDLMQRAGHGWGLSPLLGIRRRFRWPGPRPAYGPEPGVPGRPR